MMGTWLLGYTEKKVVIDIKTLRYTHACAVGEAST